MENKTQALEKALEEHLDEHGNYNLQAVLDALPKTMDFMNSLGLTKKEIRILVRTLFTVTPHY